MKEQEYIDMSDLKNLQNALDILSDIIPENSQVIEKGKFLESTSILYNYRDILREKINID